MVNVYERPLGAIRGRTNMSRPVGARTKLGQPFTQPTREHGQSRANQRDELAKL
jgi:hypothetical protein